MKKTAATACTVSLAVLLLVFSTAALAQASEASPTAQKKDLKAIEYHYQLDPSGALDASGNLAPEFLQQMAFITWKNTPSLKRGFYVDTEDRFLKSQRKVLRVRFDLAKPKKSKITLKSRGSNLARIDRLLPGTEGEIDSFFGQDQYSFAVDTPIPSKDFNLDAMTPEDALAFLKGHNQAVYNLTAPLRDHANISPLMRTPSATMLIFKGTAAEGPYKGMKVELQVWTLHDGAKPYLAEIGFDGDLTERPSLNAKDVWLSSQLKARNLLAADPGTSKTELTFQAAKN
ncbi:MAG: hypothetical protein ACNI3A_17335 [Desulfovibrio sp.]|uniref:hypothetical protein n=1 Tax=Desulfovibrio sp. 7SRBS1 TaxID=3378064 RepID=UPI003B3F0604